LNKFPMTSACTSFLFLPMTYRFHLLMVLQSSLIFQLYFLFFHYLYLNVLIHLLCLPALKFYLHIDLVCWWGFYLSFLIFEHYISRILISLFLF
jgi:hypothetical protein